MITEGFKVGWSQKGGKKAQASSSLFTLYLHLEDTRLEEEEGESFLHVMHLTSAPGEQHDRGRGQKGSYPPLLPPPLLFLGKWFRIE